MVQKKKHKENDPFFCDIGSATSMFDRKENVKPGSHYVLVLLHFVLQSNSGFRFITNICYGFQEKNPSLKERIPPQRAPNF